MNRRVAHARLAARGLIIAGGLAVLISLFLTWTSLSLQQLALLAVTASGSLGRVSLAQSAWTAYPGVAAALSGLALLVLGAAVLDRLALILPLGIACLAALGFVIAQSVGPPSALPARPGAALPTSGMVAHSTAGAGETLAIAGLILALLGMWAMLAAADTQRRRRKRRDGGRPDQRATGSAARPPRAEVPAGGPADVSA